MILSRTRCSLLKNNWQKHKHTKPLRIFCYKKLSFWVTTKFILKILKKFHNDFFFKWKTKWKKWLPRYVSNDVCIIINTIKKFDSSLENLGS